MKWTGITVGVIGTGVSAYVMIKHPEIRNEVVNGFKKGCTKMKKPFVEKQPEQQKPVREGRNNQGYFKPRYNNNKKNN